MVVEVRARWAIVRASFRSQLVYPASFALITVGSAAATFMDFAVIAIIFSHLTRLNSWSLWEVGLLYGISGTAFGLTDLMVGNLDLLSRMIKDGSFSSLLIRPLGSLFQVCAGEFSLRRIGKIAQGGTILVISLAHLGIAWTALKVAALAMTLVTSPLIFGSVWVIAITQVFWTVDSGEVANSFTYGGSFFAAYPTDVFARWLRDLLGFIVPMSFIAYFPALVILGKPDPMGLPPLTPALTPLVALALPLLASLVWRTGVRHYRGTGS